MGPLGWQETVFIFVLALLIFGPRKLPELGRTIGKAITEFRRASSDLKATFDREMRSMEQETESLREVTSSFHNELYNATSYDSSYSSSGYGYGDSYPYSDSSNGVPDSTTSTTLSASATEGAEATDGPPADAAGAQPEDAGGSQPETVPRSEEPAPAGDSDGRTVTT